MGLIDKIKDSDENQKGWRQDEVHRDCKDDFKPYDNASDCWRYSIMLFSLVMLFMRNKKKCVTNIPEMKKIQQ